MSLDTTIGGTASDSYVSVAEADAYFNARGLPTASWVGKSSASVKEPALRKATAYVDAMYQFQGIKANYLQKLQWPRASVVLFGYLVGYGDLPQILKDAVCELALKSLDDDLAPDIEAKIAVEETVGPITTKYSENQRAGGRKAFDYVDALISPLTRGGGRGTMGVTRS